MGQLLHLPIVLTFSMASFVALGQSSNDTQRTYELIEAVSEYKVFSHIHILMLFGCNIKFIRYNNCPCKCVKRKEQ